MFLITEVSFLNVVRQSSSVSILTLLEFLDGSFLQLLRASLLISSLSVVFLPIWANRSKLGKGGKDYLSKVFVLVAPLEAVQVQIPALLHS